MDSLIQYLKSHPNVKTVYFNSAGQWIFSPNKQFPIAKSVSDLLKENNAAPADEQLAAKAAADAKAKTGNSTTNKPK